MTNTWLELDVGALAGNLRGLRDALPTRTDLIFVVKANAYGHGLEPVARCAWQSGVRRFAVAHIDEAVRLRACLPDAWILLTSALAPADAPEAARTGAVPVVVGRAHAAGLSDALRGAGPGARLRCHVKVDTGMGRLGIGWERAPAAIADILAMPGLDVTGICSHFASSEAADREFADLQARRFADVLAALERRGAPPLLRHLSNSGGALREAAWDHDAVRPGILLYGYPPLPTPTTAAARHVPATPVLQWKTRVIQVKRVTAGFPVSYNSTFATTADTRLATIDVGYADGYARAASSRAEVVVGGRRCPVVGRVTMNLTVVDLGADGGQVGPGAEVALLGRQGEASVWAGELASWTDTIPYEVLTSIRTSDRRVTGACGAVTEDPHDA